MTAIWRRRQEIQQARRKVMSEAMQEYDEKIYAPAMKALVEECAERGHIKGKYWNNGLGWEWFYCQQCGARMEIQSTWPSDKHSE